jgi:hypothetical protein
MFPLLNVLLHTLPLSTENFKRHPSSMHTTALNSRNEHNTIVGSCKEDWRNRPLSSPGRTMSNVIEM